MKKINRINNKELTRIYKNIIKCKKCNGLKGYLGGPIPAVVGKNYQTKRILFLAQNPSWTIFKSNSKIEKAIQNSYKGWKRIKFNKELIEYIKDWGMYRWLPKAGIDYEDCAFLEAYKCCFEKGHKSSGLLMRGNCKHFTLAEINILKPRIILAIGHKQYELLKELKKELDFKIKDNCILPLMHTSHGSPIRYLGIGDIRKKLKRNNP